MLLPPPQRGVWSEAPTEAALQMGTAPRGEASFLVKASRPVPPAGPGAMEDLIKQAGACCR